MKQDYQLRPYQQIIYDEIPRRLATSMGVIVQAPPRSGKSKIIASTVDRITKANKIALVLSHRDKVQKQLIGHCSGISIDANVEHVFIQPGQCYVAMTQTLANRPAIMTQLQQHGTSVVLLTDECHDGSFNKIMDNLPAALRIGFSATPSWKYAKWIRNYYDSIIIGPQVKDLIASGSIVPVEYHEMVSDLDGLKKSSNGEFTEESNTFVFGKPKLYEGLFDILASLDFTGALKLAIFVGSKKSADGLFEQFKHYQVPSWRPTVYYSGRKDYELAKFTHLREANILITVRSLGTGWDHPPLTHSILFCAIGSLNTFLQIVFRNVTPHPGKELAITYDLGGNNTRFGGAIDRCAATMDRDWEALSQPSVVVRKSDGVANIKNCIVCDYMLYASARSCSNCGYLYPDVEVQLAIGELIRIQEQEAANRAQVAGRKVSTLDPVELAYYGKNANKVPYACRIAKSKHLGQVLAREVDPEAEAPSWLQLFGAAMSSLVPGKYGDNWLNYQLRTLAEERSYAHQEGKELEVAYTDIIVNMPVVQAL